METRRLRVLVELSRHGSMRAVADLLGTSTSTVSQQIATLAREVGTPLVEPVGRRVRLTPAGGRLAEHAVTILAAVEAARADLDPTSEPAGTVRVAGFATAVSRTLLPVVVQLAGRHPSVRMVVAEHEPSEALALLAANAVDLALVYDYTLAPIEPDRTLESVSLWSEPWGLGVPTRAAREVRGSALEVFAAFRAASWIGNSRNRADEIVTRTIASMAGFEPDLTHSADSLEVVEELILAGLGVGLLPTGRRVRRGVSLVPLEDPDVTQRTYAVTRRGRTAWPPLSLVLSHLQTPPG